MSPEELEPYELTAAEAAARIRAGKLGALEYARALLSRQAALESRIHALAHFEAGSLLAAAERAGRAVDAARSSGRETPPLAGIPIGVKDTIDTEGVPTRAGSALYQDRIPAKDAACLRALWESGAYLHSKTVTTELAYFDPGPTRNPWRPTHTPGGSSSGSAAGVAAGYFPIALGTQTAGSVIRPAAFCGVVGFVPTRGRVSLEGVLPFAPSVDQLGIFARSVEDAALALHVLDGEDGGGRGGGGDAERLMPLSPLERAPFLGLVREYFIDTAEDEMGRAAIHAGKILASQGAVVHVVHLPESFAQVHAHHRRLMEVEMARSQKESYRASSSLYGKKVSALIEAGLRAGEADYKKALAHRERFLADVEKVLREVDALLLPPTPFAAPYGLESTGDPRFNVPWTNAGLPALTLPAALSGSTGLPLGIQLVCARGRDAHLLRVARYVEERLGWGRRLAALPG